MPGVVRRTRSWCAEVRTESYASSCNSSTPSGIAGVRAITKRRSLTRNARWWAVRESNSRPPPCKRGATLFQALMAQCELGYSASVQLALFYSAT
jgi:hypothetical protein